MSSEKKPNQPKLPKLKGDAPQNPKNVLHIGGIPVEFPFKPYGSQLAFMGRVISTLDRAQREGHCHALLESPTGTGKSLSLLCSTLAWQRSQEKKNMHAGLTQSKPAPEAVSDPLGHGGGFIPEMDTQSASAQGNLEPGSPDLGIDDKKKRTPIIYYASRTHSQISQVVREYKKTSYRVQMAVLASRKHYCTNANVRRKPNLDEECKLLLKGSFACQEFKNMKDVKNHPSIQKGGFHEVHDIEDLVKVGLLVKGCPYYASRSMAEDAQLVFCPYNYIINPVIRAAMEVDIRGAVVILDEAHNIEDVARDAGSVDLEEDALDMLQTELHHLCDTDTATYQPLYEMIQEIMSWMRRKKDTLENREFQHYVSCWTGDKALRELQEANITPQCFPILWQCAKKAIRDVTELDTEVPSLSGKCLLTLEGLFATLSYFFSENGLHIFDYQLALRRYIKKESGHVTGYWANTLSLWCLNPGVVFKEIANLSLSVILTSGTLSPMHSFSSELGVNFGTTLEAPHVIDVEAQVWASVISTGPGNHSLNASYKTANAYVFQDALGKAIEEICKAVPGGALVFFPSYNLMEKLQSRWSATGQWSQLRTHKSVFVEPRGGSQDDFDAVLNGYYDSIRQCDAPLFQKNTRGKKLGQYNSTDPVKKERVEKDGAAFLAVCRGKVSEGIDFSDDNARVVIIVGVPFPNINDIQVDLKKKYNDTYKSTKNLLSGNQWYCLQAFRALNQAAGRCIRHRFDYGAIIFIDERFLEERNTASISKWLRNSIRLYNNFDKSLEDMKSFFIAVKEKFSKKVAEDSQGSNLKLEESCNFKIEDTPSHGPSKGFGRIKVQKLENPDKREMAKMSKKPRIENPKVLSESFSSLKKYKAMFSQKRCSENEDMSSPKLEKKKDDTFPAYINLKTDSQRESRCSPDMPLVSPLDCLEESFVSETPASHPVDSQTSPNYLVRDENCCPSICGDLENLCDLFTKSSAAPSMASCSLNSTPNGNTPKSEKESALNSSVNSHAQKRRMVIDLPSLKLFQTEDLDIIDSKTSCDNNIRDPKCVVTLQAEPTSIGRPNMELSGAQSVPGDRYDESSNLCMEKKLQIRCLACKCPLGLPENHFTVTCSLTSSSKIHLASLLNDNLQPPTPDKSPSTSVLIAGVALFDKKLCNNFEGASGPGVWCEQDGCVFKSIYCPSCGPPKVCLGVQIMATDSLNMNLLNKVLLYVDRLETNDTEVPKKEKMMLLPDHVIAHLRSYEFKHLEGSDGWRNTKSRLRLSKGARISNSED